MDRLTPFSHYPTFATNLSIETMEEITMSNTINTASRGLSALLEWFPVSLVAWVVHSSFTHVSLLAIHPDRG